MPLTHTLRLTNAPSPHSKARRLLELTSALESNAIHPDALKRAGTELAGLLCEAMVAVDSKVTVHTLTDMHAIKIIRTTGRHRVLVEVVDLLQLIDRAHGDQSELALLIYRACSAAVSNLRR